jgi:hypothetical protein
VITHEEILHSVQDDAFRESGMDKVSVYNANMTEEAAPNLKPKLNAGGRVTRTGEAAWRFEIPAGPAGSYRLAQLDDYGRLSRRSFPWGPPLSLSLRARVSSVDIQGTWGFGLWNDPFSMALARGVDVRLPAMPNAAWYFFASPPNYLSLQDDLPAQGFLAMTFRSARLPAILLALGAPALPFFFWPPALRFFRRLGRHFVRQESAALIVDPTDWHSYSLEWQADEVDFQVDGERALQSAAVPHGSLGLVMWVDNQYAALTPEGRLGFGTLPNERVEWLEIEGLGLRKGGV